MKSLRQWNGEKGTQSDENFGIWLPFVGIQDMFNSSSSSLLIVGDYIIYHNSGKCWKKFKLDKWWNSVAIELLLLLLMKDLSPIH
jgi:hypothetical protein